MEYITFEEYEKLGGVVKDSSAFSKYERQARRKLDYYTQNRIKSLEVIPDEVKDCMAEFIDSLYEESEKGPDVKSFNHDGVSVTYADSDEQDIEELLWDIAVEYLPVGLVSLAVN